METKKEYVFVNERTHQLERRLAYNEDQIHQTILRIMEVEITLTESKNSDQPSYAILERKHWGLIQHRDQLGTSRAKMLSQMEWELANAKKHDAIQQDAGGSRQMDVENCAVSRYLEFGGVDFLLTLPQTTSTSPESATSHGSNKASDHNGLQREFRPGNLDQTRRGPKRKHKAGKVAAGEADDNEQLDGLLSNVDLEKESGRRTLAAAFRSVSSKDLHELGDGVSDARKKNRERMRRRRAHVRTPRFVGRVEKSERAEMRMRMARWMMAMRLIMTLRSSADCSQRLVNEYHSQAVKV